jgi:predicted HAD superfamily Cof-like phosphohydrolase
MNKHLENVKEFHEIFKSYIGYKKEVPDEDTIKLRLSLILEELVELATASGEKSIFYLYRLMSEKIDKISNNEIVSDNKDGTPNIKNCLDALGDIDYVLNGTVISYGLHDVFDEACDDIHLSNMSKVCKTKEEAELTIKSRENDEYEYYISEYDKKANGYFVYRKSDNKLIKSINYNPVNLEKYFD